MTRGGMTRERKVRDRHDSVSKCRIAKIYPDHNETVSKQPGGEMTQSGNYRFTSGSFQLREVAFPRRFGHGSICPRDKHFKC